MFDKLKLEIMERIDLMRLNSQRRDEERGLQAKKDFEKEKLKLEQTEELETIKAKIRKQEAKSQQKPGKNAQQAKSGFDKFRDFATNFANQPSYMKHGDLNGNKKSIERNGKGTGPGYF